MSKFIIECPACHSYAQASTGFFASRRVRCSCGNTIHVKTDRMATKVCPSCGNNVVYDQAEGTRAKCPVCHAQLVTEASYRQLLQFRCNTCGCQLQAAKSAASITCPVCDTVCDVQREIKLAEAQDAGIPSVIRYAGDSATLVWKHPMTDFVTGSQLIVHESQEAVFYRNGEALDSFGPGRHTLETGVLPRMEQLYHLPAQGQMFHAEVYFVNLATQMGVKWGTPSKVGLFDPATGLHVELGASGSFNLRVVDARKLLIRVVGTTNGLSQQDVFSQNGTGYFRSIVMAQVKAQLAKVIKANRLNVLELDAHLDSIGAALKAAINPELADYGLEMPEFYINNIVTPDDDPNFRRMKQQHADMYLKTREEEIRKAEAEAAFERKSIEAQTEARMKMIGAQGDAEALKIRAAAEAEAYRLQAQAEAQEMQMKGYTYQQETARQVGLGAVQNSGGIAGGIGGTVGDLMGLGVGLGAVGSVIGMTKEAITPVASAVGNAMNPAAEGWSCACGKQNISSKFCPECGSRKPEADTWNCACGKMNISSKFCPECGARKPEADTWDCACGKRGIQGKFCPECGAKKPEADNWNCACGKQGIQGKFCPECGAKKPE